MNTLATLYLCVSPYSLCSVYDAELRLLAPNATLVRGFAAVRGWC